MKVIKIEHSEKLRSFSKSILKSNQVDTLFPELGLVILLEERFKSSKTVYNYLCSLSI